MAEVVEWSKTLEQVEGDEEFLEEVLGDLIKEANEAKMEMEDGIRTENWNSVSKAAHRVKGSSSYLYCEQLRVCCVNLQDLGAQAINASPQQVIEIAKSIDAWFADYTGSLQRVESAVRERYSKGK